MIVSVSFTASTKKKIGRFFVLQMYVYIRKYVYTREREREERERQREREREPVLASQQALFFQGVHTVRSGSGVGLGLWKYSR